MDWTDRHDRFFLRLITRHTRLYTEMVTADAIRFGDRARLLDFDAAEHPLALQVGGSDPTTLAEASQIWEDEQRVPRAVTRAGGTQTKHENRE